ncbi:MAG: hypothetical protein ACK5TR_01825 [Alphaproteobacteria bacterium]|jgi:hypothetical protein|nr:hypothetical protein [Alphaproteobacteria bacterium]
MHQSTSFFRFNALFIFSTCLHLLGPLSATDHKEEHISTTTTSVFPYLELPNDVKYQVLSSALTPEKDGFCFVSPFVLRLVNHFSRDVMDQCVTYPVRAFNLKKFWHEDGSVHGAAFGKRFLIEGWIRHLPQALTALQCLPTTIKIDANFLGTFAGELPEWVTAMPPLPPQLKITLTQTEGLPLSDTTPLPGGVNIRHLNTMWEEFCNAYGDHTLPTPFKHFLKTHPTQAPLWSLLDAMKVQMRAPFSSTLFMSPYVIPLGSHELNHTLEEITAACTLDFQRSMSVTNLASFWMGALELTPDQWHAKIPFIEKANVSIFGRQFLWENVLPSVASASSKTMFDALELLEKHQNICPFTEIEMTYLFCALCRYPSSEERFIFLINTLENPIAWREEVMKLELAKDNITYTARSDTQHPRLKKGKRSKLMPSNEKCIIS